MGAGAGREGRDGRGMRRWGVQQGAEAGARWRPPSMAMGPFSVSFGRHQGRRDPPRARAVRAKPQQSMSRSATDSASSASVGRLWRTSARSPPRSPRECSRHSAVASRRRALRARSAGVVQWSALPFRTALRKGRRASSGAAAQASAGTATTKPPRWVKAICGMAAEEGVNQRQAPGAQQGGWGGRRVEAAGGPAPGAGRGQSPPRGCPGARAPPRSPRSRRGAPCRGSSSRPRAPRTPSSRSAGTTASRRRRRRPGAPRSAGPAPGCRAPAEGAGEPPMRARVG